MIQLVVKLHDLEVPQVTPQDFIVAQFCRMLERQDLLEDEFSDNLLKTAARFGHTTSIVTRGFRGGNHGRMVALDC